MGPLPVGPGGCCSAFAKALAATAAALARSVDLLRENLVTSQLHFARVASHIFLEMNLDEAGTQAIFFPNYAL